MPAALELQPLTLGPMQPLPPERVQAIQQELASHNEQEQKERREKAIVTDNTDYLVKLVQEVGWIDVARFGEKASVQATIMIKHTGSLPFMIAVLPYVEKELKYTGAGQTYAVLYDSVQLALGKKQRYGTQIGFDAKGAPYRLPCFTTLCWYYGLTKKETLMKRLSSVAAVSFLVGGLVVVGAYPVNAGGVSCGPGGECFDVSPGFSGNCECRIRNVAGVAVCKPAGICDPSDTTSCDDGPQPNVSPGVEVSAKFLSRLAEKNPRLAGAVWGALMEEDSSSREVLRYRLVAGDHTGTMGKNGRSYTFRTRVQPLSGDDFFLSVLVEEDGTGRAEEFTGSLL